MTVVAQQLFVARLIASTQVQRFDVINHIAENAMQPFALARLTQPMIPLFDCVAILNPCTAPLAFYDVRLRNENCYACAVGRLEAWLKGLQLHLLHADVRRRARDRRVVQPIACPRHIAIERDLDTQRLAVGQQVDDGVGIGDRCGAVLRVHGLHAHHLVEFGGDRLLGCFFGLALGGELVAHGVLSL